VNPAAYLDADASTLADREHTNTHTNTNRRRLTESHLVELEFAVSLLRRADKAISDELAVLRGLDVGINWDAVQRALGTLLGTAVEMHLVVAQERAGRSA
jgi:hypothetical protein